MCNQDMMFSSCEVFSLSRRKSWMRNSCLSNCRLMSGTVIFFTSYICFNTCLYFHVESFTAFRRPKLTSFLLSRPVVKARHSSQGQVTPGRVSNSSKLPFTRCYIFLRISQGLAWPWLFWEAQRKFFCVDALL